MKLTEAAATGRPYKRKSDTSWRQPHHNHTFAPGDLVADDWEIEEKLVPITKSQFLEAFDETFEIGDRRAAATLASEMARRLGLT